jgi:hypothetical protein
MYLPRGRHADSITYRRVRLSHSEGNIAVWDLIDNEGGNVLGRVDVHSLNTGDSRDNRFGLIPGVYFVGASFGATISLRRLGR